MSFIFKDAVDSSYCTASKLRTIKSDKLEMKKKPAGVVNLSGDSWV